MTNGHQVKSLWDKSQDHGVQDVSGRRLGCRAMIYTDHRQVNGTVILVIRGTLNGLVALKHKSLTKPSLELAIKDAKRLMAQRLNRDRRNPAYFAVDRDVILTTRAWQLQLEHALRKVGGRLLYSGKDAASETGRRLRILADEVRARAFSKTSKPFLGCTKGRRV